MEEAFRRAIRKMTGASVRLAVRPNRSAIVATLSQSMMVTWSIALFEHLDAMLNNPDANVGSSELISYSESAWKLCESGFPQIFKDCEKLYSEFRAKWIQRFSTDEVLRLLLEGGDFLVHDEEKGWALTVKNNKQDINNFYSATIHLLVSDAEPLFVRMHGRVMQLQEKLCKYWLSESAVDPVSKLLPCLEASLREKENAMVVSLRTSLNSLAKKRFAAAFASKGPVRYYSSAMSCARASSHQSRKIFVVLVPSIMAAYVASSCGALPWPAIAAIRRSIWSLFGKRLITSSTEFAICYPSVFVYIFKAGYPPLIPRP